MVAYAPTPHYSAGWRDTTSSPSLRLFELPRAISYTSGARASLADPFGTYSFIWMGAFSAFSNCRNFEVIYEARGFRDRWNPVKIWPGEQWHEATLDNPISRWGTIPTKFHFQCFSGKGVSFSFNHTNEIIPRRIRNCDPDRFLRMLFLEHTNEPPTWMELIVKDNNETFALIDIFSSDRYYREFAWDPQKYIITFEFINENHIQLVYFDMIFEPQYNELTHIWNVLNDDDTSFLRKWTRRLRDEVLDFASYKIIPLDSYINNVSPFVDYRYNFMYSANVYEHVTKRNLQELRMFSSSKLCVQSMFQTQGKLVKEYTYNGNTFQIYGFMGQGAAIFTVFHQDELIAAEFINPYFYNGRGTTFPNQEAR